MEKLIGKKHLEAFEHAFNILFLNNQDAVRLALDILYIVHVWDDLIDEDEISKEYISGAFRRLIYDVPRNPIMCAASEEMSTLWLSCYHQWLSANAIENSNEPTDNELAKAYMLRASIYQLFGHIAAVVGGIEYAEKVYPDVYALYGETLAGFIEEIRNA